MSYKQVSVPPTKDQGSANFVVHHTKLQTAAQDALQTYNKMRERDGQDFLTRMPNGTTYTKFTPKK